MWSTPYCCLCTVLCSSSEVLCSLLSATSSKVQSLQAPKSELLSFARSIKERAESLAGYVLANPSCWGLPLTTARERFIFVGKYYALAEGLLINPLVRKKPSLKLSFSIHGRSP